ncbi:MAG: glycosyltransferase family 2 protein [Pirellulales bacterium]|nr:glycosyltransferase family 2 protein [Pirellulales bacterium]
MLMHSENDPARSAETPAVGPTSERRLSPETRVSIVIPCFHEEAVLPLLFERLSREADRWNLDYEVLVVDDGSRDRTWELLVAQHARDPRWKLIRFARNFGQQIALRAGLQATTGDLVVMLDADLQDPPEVLPQLFESWASGYDVVVGVRRKRKEGLPLRSAYFLFYRLLALLSPDETPLDGGDFCVMDRKIVDIICRMPERRPFIRGLRSWVGFRQQLITYDRHHRAAGKPKYTLFRLFGLALDGFLSSSVLPLRLATLCGAVVAFLALLGSIFALLVGMFPAQASEYFGLHAIPGSATIVISILFLGAVQLICLGISGEYLGRIYENVKGRPFWTIRETLGVREEAVATERRRPLVAERHNSHDPGDRTDR